jgi:hypothetical protein
MSRERSWLMVFPVIATIFRLIAYAVFCRGITVYESTGN